MPTESTQHRHRHLPFGKSMVADNTGWQEFTPTERITGGYGQAFIDQAYAICDWIDGRDEDYRGQARYGNALLNPPTCRL